MNDSRGWSLLCRIGTRLCALPLSSVVETLRPLPVEPVAGAPDFVLGLSVVRGGPVPIVDAGMLLAGEAGRPCRVVIVKAGTRRVGLAVDAVVGLRQLESRLEELPPLLRGESGGRVTAVAALDAELLLVLQAMRLVPEEALAALEAKAAAS
jgi:purine-binding chemotaxis protein CheW